MIIFLFSDFKFGGSQKISIDVYNELIKKKIKSKILVINDKGNLKKRIKHNSNIYNLNSSRLLLAIFKIYKFLSKEDVKKVFCTQPHLGILIYFISFFLKNKISIIVRETNTTQYHSFLYVGLKKHLENFSKKIIFNYIDTVIFPSKNIAYKLNCKSIVIPNFVDIEEIKKTKKTYHKNFILAMGRLTKQKGFDVLIKSFDKVKNRINKNLYIFGEGEDENKLKLLIKEKKLEKRVKILNFIQNPFIYLKSCDLFVLSSRWEGLPNILIQALACKSNILSTDCKFGPKEILKNGKLGYLCKVDSVKDMSEKIIMSLLKKKQILKQDINKYSKITIIKKYIELLS